MTSVNHFPTFNYSQPDDYHFSHDSVFLAREIYEKHIDNLDHEIQILDLCAGCGIVGLDFLFHRLKEKNNFLGQVDFIENQGVYYDHFKKNVLAIQNLFPRAQLNLNWIEANYANIKSNKKYDLIISNPPYFLSHQGKLSPNEFKNRCRFFIDSEWQELAFFINNSLSVNGVAYFLVRDELKSIMQKSDLPGVKRIQFDLKIRGTWVAILKNTESEI
jgi:tRNA1Val (adenine37-N6)-methyltransferase